jgi:hypothetical protein
MTIIVKREGMCEEVIDCAPIEKYTSLLEEACRTGKVPPTELFYLADSMSREQMRHLVSTLASMATHYARLWNYSFTTQHAVMVEQLRNLKQFAKEWGEDIWPELGD